MTRTSSRFFSSFLSIVVKPSPLAGAARMVAPRRCGTQAVAPQNRLR
jgi:hypothetical protein